MRHERSGHTLQPTALLHEAIVRLLGEDRSLWTDNQRFLIRISLHMDRILVDYARRRSAQKRGQDPRRVDLDATQLQSGGDLDRMIALEEAIQRLRCIDGRAAQVALMRFAMDLTEAETAELLGVSIKTVQRDWQFARAWLKNALEERQVVA